VVVGPGSSLASHSAALAVNAAAEGKAVFYTETINPMPSEQSAGLKALVADMNAGKVQWLVMLGVNPLYNAPVDLEFEAAFSKVPMTVHLGSHLDETGFYSTWHINKTHYLESWTDARAYDGTISVVQPMIAPLYGGKSSHDVLQALLSPSVSAYDAVLANAKTYITGADFGMAWRKTLHDGWVATSAFTPKTLGAPKSVPAPASAAVSGIENQLQAGCFDLRRPLWKQRLAAGAAQAGDERLVG